ncbi:hypothetical protein BDL97_02G129600 [Sphagnum fallax]|nr:hypothetical protein BDL97_02G129600 [Sphagnum fallax]
MAAGNGTPAAIVAAAMMEEGLGMGTVNGHDKGNFWSLDQNMDKPLGLEANRVQSMQYRKVLPLGIILRLAYQSLGVVYGDVGTSPLYVFQSTFPDGVTDGRDILGALSLIIYTITIITLVKYMFIVLRANNDGEGGTFALYSLLCRHCNISALPNKHPTDEELTTFVVNCGSIKKTWLQKKLESSKVLQRILFIVVLCGTSMVIGDGILTPAISDVVTLISLVILVLLFSVQRFGTARVGVMFAPVFLLWFISIAVIGVYNIIKYDKAIFKAFSPLEIIHFFRRNGRAGWIHLGGIVLSITGTEAIFADLGHFTFQSIQIAFTGLVYPCLLLAYIGQAAFVSRNLESVGDAFYSSIPHRLYWPMFALSTVAAVIGSQAIISATFSIVKQSVALGWFPRVKIVHTSNQVPGRIYIPEINWMLMVLCLVVTAGFTNTSQIGNAYGIAVVAVMLVTTVLLTVVMIIVWHKPIFVALAFLMVFGTIESIYVSSALYKVSRGGWVPLVIAVAVGSITYVWHYGTLKRFEHEIQNKVPMGWLLGLGPSLGLVRVPGIGLVYTDLVHGVPPIFSHFITNLPAIHSTVVFVNLKYLPVSTVPQEERFLIHRIGPKVYSMYRCAARYGYRDVHKKDDRFEQLLIESLITFIKFEALQGSSAHESLAASYTPDEESVSSMHQPTGAMNSPAMPGVLNLQGDKLDTSTLEGSSTIYNPALLNPSQEISSIHSRDVQIPNSQGVDTTSRDETAFILKGKDAGVVYLLGNSVVKARTDSSFVKKLIIDYAYSFLQRICRDSHVTLNIPHESLLQVGMVYNV